MREPPSFSTTTFDRRHRNPKIIRSRPNSLPHIRADGVISMNGFVNSPSGRYRRDRMHGVYPCLNSLDAWEKVVPEHLELFSHKRIAGTRGCSPCPPLVSGRCLHKLVVRSDEPQVKEFQNRVTKVVLPGIRKDGGHIFGEEKPDQFNERPTGGFPRGSYPSKSLNSLCQEAVARPTRGKPSS